MCLGEDRFLLNDIHGELKGGWLCAIMGPSGAGKSTLLNMLALHPSPNTTVRGHLSVQGVPLTDSSFRTYCAYVPQVSLSCF
jgi:ATP-binding cassette, subfamily G (WHITE), member 2, SNQ2